MGEHSSTLIQLCIMTSSIQADGSETPKAARTLAAICAAPQRLDVLPWDELSGFFVVIVV